MKINNVFYWVIFSFTIHLHAMDTIKAIAMAGCGTFGPKGKHLLILEDKNVGVHETATGRRLGSLENSSSLDAFEEFVFSPQETYINSANRIWTTADQKERQLTNILTKRQQIKAWNKHETIFLSENAKEKKWFFHKAQDGQIIYIIVHPLLPLHFSISDDGSLAGLTYSIIGLGNATRMVLHDLNNARQISSTPDMRYVNFFPDNTHALVASNGAGVHVINAKTAAGITFVCGNNRERLDNTPCAIQINGMQGIISHPSDRDAFCTITHDGQKFDFQRHDKSYRAPHTQSTTKQFKVIAHGTSYSNNLFLENLTVPNASWQVIMPSVNAEKKDVFFSGNHDEHILVRENKEGRLYILYAPSTEYLGRIDYKRLTISPDKNSFLITTKNDDNFLYILPHAAEILAKQKDSYFNLLPIDLRAYLKNIQTTGRNEK